VAEERSDLAAVVRAAVHDLRTPLATVYGFARTLDRLGGLDPRQQRFLDLVVDGADEMRRQLDDLALCARAADGSLLPRPQPVDLRNLVADAAARASEQASDGRHVEAFVPERPVAASTDAELTTGALTRLALAVLRLEPERELAELRLDGHGVVRLEAGETTRGLVTAPARDLSLAAAHAALRVVGVVASADANAVVVRLPTRAAT
jgi:signal transduction histidine kinase